MTYSLTRCSFPGPRTGGTGLSCHSAAVTRLSGWRVRGWGREAEHGLSRGHQPALCHCGRAVTLKRSRCCPPINSQDKRVHQPWVSMSSSSCAVYTFCFFFVCLLVLKLNSVLYLISGNGLLQLRPRHSYPHRWRLNHS